MLRPPETLSATRRPSDASVRDPMTKVFNRHYLADRVAFELALSHRTMQDVALLLIDVDNLAGVNDRVGHLAGDRALCVVAGHIAQFVHAEHVLARYGGDEFAVLAGRTPLVEARRLAERVRGAIDHLHFSA